MKLLPLLVISFILTGALLCSCDSKITDNPCDTCGVPCDTCDTTELPCDTCDTTGQAPDPNDTTSHDFTWTEYSIPGEIKITGCWVHSDKLIQVMGQYFYQWEGGTEWNKRTVFVHATKTYASFPDFTLFCLTPNLRWMVNGIAFYSDGGSAVRYETGGYSCWGTAFNNMFFVGNGGYISHFDGENFINFPMVTEKPLYNIWGTSNQDIWASGYNESTAQSTLIHYNGINWSEEDVDTLLRKGPIPHALGEVWSTDSAGHRIVVASGSLLHRKTDNGPWRSDSGLIKNRLNDGSFIGLWHVAGNSINDFTAAGDGGFISHWNGKTWKRFDELYNPGDFLYITDAMHQKGNTICVVGKKNGTGWIAIGRRK